MAMVGAARFVGPALLAVGGFLLAYSLLSGSARLYLVLFVPVITGTTPLFGVSVAVLAAGFLTLPLRFSEGTGDEAATGPEPTRVRPADATEDRSGGLILLGPVPIFFGAWRRRSPIGYRWAVVLGAALVAVAVLVLWGTFGL